MADFWENDEVIKPAQNNFWSGDEVVKPNDKWRGILAPESLITPIIDKTIQDTIKYGEENDPGYQFYRYGLEQDKSPLGKAKLDRFNELLNEKKKKEAKNTGYAEDISKSFGTGIEKGIAGLAALPNLVEQGARWAFGSESNPWTYGYGDYVNTLERLHGGNLYEPKTLPGEYSQTVGEFLPGIAVPGGAARSLGKTALTNVVAPAVASETAGQLTKGSEAEPYARLAGAVLGDPAISAGPARAVLEKVKGIPPSKEAVQKLADAVSKDAQVKIEPIMSPAEVTLSVAHGQPLANIDVAGEMTRGLGRSAVDTSDVARSILVPKLIERNSQQLARFDDMITNVGGDANATRLLDEIADEARKSRQPLYDAAYKKGNKGITGDWLKKLQEAPAVQSAMKAAKERLSNIVATEGKVIYEVPGKENVYSLTFWDKVKQNIDDKIGVAQRAGELGKARELTKIKHRLVEGLDNAVPEYSVARGEAARLFGTADAVKQGQEFASKKGRYRTDDVRKVVAKMNDEERYAFQQGYLSRLRQEITEIPETHNLSKRILATAAEKERARIALGDDVADQLEQFLGVENRMAKSLAAVEGNSKTARYLQDILRVGVPSAGGATAGFLAGNVPGAVLGALIPVLGKKGLDKFLHARRENVATELAKLLASQDTGVIRNVQQAPKSATSNLSRILSDQILKQTPRAPIIFGESGN